MVTQIVGISLVRNEDIFISQAITNVAEFCDKIIVLDNLSTDNTWYEIQELKKQYPHIEAHRINDYRESHSYISGYAGSNTWILGIDGDEVYDPTGLKRFRKCLLAGHFDDQWALFGNVVNCVELDSKREKAIGYLSPPSRSMTKLFNFSALESWHGPCERLHGGEKQFRVGFGESQRFPVNEHNMWHESPFRCLHLCFVQRSTKETKGAMSRLQPGEKPQWLKHLDRLGIGGLFSGVIQNARSPWKDSKYRRGQMQTVDARIFFPKEQGAD